MVLALRKTASNNVNDTKLINAGFEVTNQAIPL
jgi:hypothetical protein